MLYLLVDAPFFGYTAENDGTRYQVQRFALAAH